MQMLIQYFTEWDICGKLSIYIKVNVRVYVFVFPIEKLYEVLTEYFMIESYVIFFEKVNVAIFI